MLDIGMTAFITTNDYITNQSHFHSIVVGGLEVISYSTLRIVDMTTVSLISKYDSDSSSTPFVHSIVAGEGVVSQHYST